MRSQMEHWARSQLDGYDISEYTKPLFEKFGISHPWSPYPSDLLLLQLIICQQKQIDELIDLNKELIDILRNSGTSVLTRHNGSAETDHEHELFDNVDSDRLEALKERLEELQ